MAKKTEVQAEITVKDAGSAVLQRIKQAFLGAADASEEAQEGALGFAKQVAATALGTHLPSLVEHAKQLGIGFFHAGVEAQSADQAVAGLIASVQGISWKDAIDEAGVLGDHIDDIAVSTGQLGSDVAAAFNALLELRGATEETMEDNLIQTKQMAQVANVLGKSAENIAREFGLMQEGALRTKGQLFQLLQSTGIFGDKVKEAAGRWSQMTEESRVKALAYGLGIVSSRLAEATPTIGDYLTTLNNLKDIAIEKFSEPLTRSLEPVLKNLIEKLKASIPAIEKFAEALAKDAGEWVKEAVDGMEKGFQYIRTHHEEIRDALKEGWETAKSVVEFIVRNKEAIAIAYGVKTAMPAAQAVGRSVKGIYDIGAGAAGMGIFGKGAGLGAAASGGIAVGAFAAAVAGFALAVDQWRSLMNESEGGKSAGEQDQSARGRFFGRMVEEATSLKVGSEEFDRLRAAYVKQAQELGENSRLAGEQADKAWESYREIRRWTEGADTAAKMMDQFNKSLQAGMIPDEASLATQQQLIDQVAMGFDTARQRQNASAMQYIADTLLKSEGLRNAFLTSANLTGDAFDTLAELVEGKSKEFAEALRARAGEGKATATTPKAPTVVFTGDIHIKQDFRDQDPDRVALVFERDIARMTERKIQAGTSSPFGV